MKIARIYLRVSTDEQNLERQEEIIQSSKANDFYIAGVYREKASGSRSDRPELLRLINDLQAGEVVIAEKIDRISRLPLPEAERLIQSIVNKGARLCIPGLIDLSEFVSEVEGIPKIVLESMQALLLKIALQMAREDYEDRRKRQNQGIRLAKDSGKYKGKRADTKTHEQIIALRKTGRTISETAAIAKCSIPQVKKVWANYQKSLKESENV
jgi:DNA invertase Pin-like site-specific DNA recombinase